VFKALDKICDYYEKHEPSSPIPLLLRRAQKLSSMTFLEIIRELAPGGLDEAHRAGGIPAE
jgi:type VI secretion system protein ImpA